MKQNIEYAKKHLDEHPFARYSTAYVATNEDLRNALKCMPKDTTRALTVAASGDHPMFAKLYGAKYVDTFDISFNARLIMDIKTHALSLLNYEEYRKLLICLYFSQNITSIENMPQIIERLTTFEQKYIKEIQGNRLFNKQIHLSSISFPTETEFQKMQQNINKPFKFIWSDLQTLHTKLTKTYDFIHLSNIFDYLGTYQDCIDVLNSLVSYTNPGCKICITCFVKDAEAICEKFVWNQAMQTLNGQEWRGNPVHEIKNCTCVLHRVR